MKIKIKTYKTFFKLFTIEMYMEAKFDTVLQNSSQ